MPQEQQGMSDKNFNINPIISLAYNMADCRQKYALFVGAGVSKDAGVPSGWDILIETMKKIVVQEEGTKKDIKNVTKEEAEKFYKDKFEETFGYSDIIDELFPSREEQRDYLKGFFKGIAPGEAHRLIAELMKEKLIKYIITTNFDTLIETALDDAGLKGKYTVIDSNDDVLTSKPWTKEDVCRLYKIHGTIEKGIIRNTKKDLALLPEELKKDCFDVIERHGVIVLGYAANEEDKAVCEIFNSRKFKGYTLYWTSLDDKLSNNAAKIVNKQDGVTIPIKGAALFLQELRGRIKIAQRGSEQTPEAVAMVRFESLFKAPNPEIEILQTIDREKTLLVNSAAQVLGEIREVKYDTLWDGFVKIFKSAHNYLLLMEQIIKYKNGYWEPAAKIFEQIHSLNKSGERYGKEGVVNYLFYCMLEITGAMILENGKYRLLREMLEINRLNRQGNGMESILQWAIHGDFIENKNQAETKRTVPQFHYLRGLMQVQDFPLKFEFQTELMETDLLYFVYSIKNGESFSRWFPCSPVYSRQEAPPLFKKIRYDEKFGAQVAGQLFDTDYTALLEILRKADEIIQTQFQAAYDFSRNVMNVLEIFRSENKTG